MIETIIAFFMTKAGGMLAAIVGGIAVLFGTYFKGKSTGATEEKNEREIKVNKQNAEAREIVKEVQNEQAKMSIPAVRERAAAKWLRK